MKNNYSPLISILFIAAILIWAQFTLMPPWVSDNSAPLSEFSTRRAMEHVVEIAKQPHYVGSPGHDKVADYIKSELTHMGLTVTTQTGTTLSDWGNLAKSTNIIAHIPGSGGKKALVLLSHYDSAPHSKSKGASDDGSGIATILESIRAFTFNREQHRNDIVILFTDAEELGLNGAALFVTEHKLADEVGLVLNFEARGTSGPGYMLMEVNNGNSEIVDHFASAAPRYPVSNSLMYSIYKMLPNDTDLTVFRENGKIQGLNFAFIDSHFNYHTAQDDAANLDPKTLSHQGSYLVPLLDYFSNTDLSTLNSSEDQVYFNTPLTFIHYSFWWNIPLVAVAVILFLFFVFIGIGKRILQPRQIGIGFIVFLGVLLLSGVIAFFGWNAILGMYPQYSDILQGFTYNGHAYIGMVIFMTTGICLLFYAKPKPELYYLNYSVAPLLIWLLINLGIAMFLPGAGFFIIPVIFTVIMFGAVVITQRTNLFLNLLLSVPALLIFVPFIIMFPIGLGLKIIAGSAILTVLVFGLLLPVFAAWQRKTAAALISLAVALGFFVYAHLNSGYEPGKAKPNSLVYIVDADQRKAFYATYDENPDEWTQTYVNFHGKPDPVLAGFPLFSKYGTQITHTTPTQSQNFAVSDVEFLRDTVIGTQRHLKIQITPIRKVNRYDIFAGEKMVFHNFRANGAKPLGQQGSRYARNGKKILSYYVVDNEPLTMEFSVPFNTVLDMTFFESSFDLLSNPAIKIKARSNWMMPKPFVLNDAVILKKKLEPSKKIVMPVTTFDELSAPVAIDTTDAGN